MSFENVWSRKKNGLKPRNFFISDGRGKFDSPLQESRKPHHHNSMENMTFRYKKKDRYVEIHSFK